MDNSDIFSDGHNDENRPLSAGAVIKTDNLPEQKNEIEENVILPPPPFIHNHLDENGASSSRYIYDDQPPTPPFDNGDHDELLMCGFDNSDILKKKESTEIVEGDKSEQTDIKSTSPKSGNNDLKWQLVENIRHNDNENSAEMAVITTDASASVLKPAMPLIQTTVTADQASAMSNMSTMLDTNTDSMAGETKDVNYDLIRSVKRSRPSSDTEDLEVNEPRQKRNKPTVILPTVTIDLTNEEQRPQNNCHAFYQTEQMESKLTQADPSLLKPMSDTNKDNMILDAVVSELRAERPTAEVDENLDFPNIRVVIPTYLVDSINFNQFKLSNSLESLQKTIDEIILGIMPTNARKLRIEESLLEPNPEDVYRDMHMPNHRKLRHSLGSICGTIKELESCVTSHTNLHLLKFAFHRLRSQIDKFVRNAKRFLIFTRWFPRTNIILWVMEMSRLFDIVESSYSCMFRYYVKPDYAKEKYHRFGDQNDDTTVRSMSSVGDAGNSTGNSDSEGSE